MCSRGEKMLKMVQRNSGISIDPGPSCSSENSVPRRNKQSSCSDDSSDVPSIPADVQEQLADIFNSDDEDLDPDFFPEIDNSSRDSLDIEIKKPPPRKRKEEFEVNTEVDEQNIEVTQNDGMEHAGKRSKRSNKETRKIREERKLNRNTGKEYVTRKNKVVPEKTIKELRNCRNKCVEKFDNNIRATLFNDFWSMGSYNRRTQYISDLISLVDKKVIRIRKPGSNKKRTDTAVYHFRINNSLKRTCKDCLRRTFDISNKFIEIIMQRKRGTNISGIMKLDGRETHTNRKKISDDDKQTVKEHILSIPAYESHYTRRQSSKKYLPQHYTLTSLYQAYKQNYPTNFINRRAYEEIFYSLNIKIKQPKKDTCCTCDKLQMKFKMAKSESEKAKLNQELADHHQRADEGYTTKNDDKTASKSDPQKKTICFDLQQCLPTPDVQSGEAFYKRQLWTYNLTVHDSDDAQAFCYLWYESLAKRGANDIGSCLYRYLTKDIDPAVTHIVMYSDSCGGQNKNSYISAVCLVALQNCENLAMIDHKFLLPGHTHMECDTDHSLIEKKKKKSNLKIEHPHDWAQLIRLVGKKKSFVVREMEKSDFFDFAGLYSKSLVNRKQDTMGGKFNWREVRWIRYIKNNKSFFYKTSLNENEDFKTLSLERRGRTNNEVMLNPEKAYDKPIPITVEKKQHLIDLLPYISEGNWDFYKNLKTSSDQIDVFPDVSSDEEEPA